MLRFQPNKHRKPYRESIDEILSEPYDFNKVKPCIESKVFGIGVEAYTVGSGEFALSYAAMNKDKCIPLMDNGHYHPTEVVSDKIPALLAFFPEIIQDAVRDVNLHRECPEVGNPLESHIIGLDDLRTHLLESHLTLVQENLNLLYLTGERDFCLEGVKCMLPQFFDFFFFPHIIFFLFFSIS